MIPLWGNFYPGASLALDFVNGRYRNGGGRSARSAFASLPNLTVTRASTKFALNSAGLAVPFASGVASIVDLGCLIEESRATLANKSRRLDDAAQWTLSTMTTSPVVGVDGANASATRITASGANATALGIANTSASSARRVAPFIRRVAGTGNIDLTLDGGSTWTTLNGLTASYQRIGVGQTVANPKVGIRIVSSGDSVDVDFLGGETGAFDTSPMESASAVFTRAADSVSIATNYAPANAPVTIYGEWTFAQLPSGNTAILGTNTKPTLALGSSYVKASFPGVADVATKNTAPSIVAVNKAAAAFAPADFAATIGGAAPTTGSGATTWADATTLSLGMEAVSLNGYIRKAIVYPSRLSNAALQSLTT